MIESGACVALLGWTAAVAQAPGPAAPVGGVNAILAKLFGAYPGFTAQAEARVVGARNMVELEMPMTFAQRDGNTRIEIDIARIKSKGLSSEQIADMKEKGLNHIISIIRPDKKASYVLFPATQHYTVVPMPKSEVDALAKKLKLDQEELGRETVDGHPCIKHRVKLKDGQTVLLEATTWNATDLKGFPIRIETRESGKTSTLQFRQVQFTRPDAAQFDPPPSYSPVGGQ